MNNIVFHQKLLFKIFFTVLLATGTTVVVVGFLSFYFTRSALEHSVMENQEGESRHIMDKIDRTLYERYLDIQTIAGEQSFKEHLLSVVRGTGTLEDTVRHDNVKRLKDLAVVTGPWNTLFIVDSKGNIIFSTLEEEEGKPLNRWYYKNLAYQKAMKGEVNHTDFVVLKHSGELAVVFAAPIRDEANPQHPAIGAVIGDLSWMAVSQILDDNDEDIFLLNHDGNIIASNTESVERILSDLSQGKSILGELDEKNSMVIRRNQGIFKEDTLVSQAAQRGYLSYKGNGWSLIESKPARVAFAPANQSATKIVLILIPIIFLKTLVILLIIYRFILKPVSILNQTIDEISSGDLTKQAPITSNDEIGQLAVSFNAMTGKLKELYETMEQRVVERTLELTQANKNLEAEFEQRRTIEDDLRTSEERSRAIIETASDAFISMDEEGLITDWNRVAENIFGWSRSEIMGRPMAETIIPQQYRENHIKGLQHFLKTGEGSVLRQMLELSALHRSGREFRIEITIWPIQIKQKYQFNAFVRDITKRKETEEKLKKAHQEVEGREKALRNTLVDLQKSHENLKQAQNQLLQSEKLASIGQLAAGVAHEINNPVGFISNNMEMLTQYVADYGKLLKMVKDLRKNVETENIQDAKSLSKEIERFEQEINFEYIVNDTDKLLKYTQKGIERIQKIVKDLRTFAREDGEDMDTLRIEEVIDSILSIVHNELKYKAELKKEYGDTPMVKCSPQRLGQVFINLFMNAAQAIKEKGKIEVKTYRQENFVCVDVHDTGQGIPEENIKKVFDPFFTTKPVGQGTGLGLSVSYEIIKKHGGEIKVNSKVNEGTTFTVLLPIS